MIMVRTLDKTQETRNRHYGKSEGTKLTERDQENKESTSTCPSLERLWSSLAQLNSKQRIL